MNIYNLIEIPYIIDNYIFKNELDGEFIIHFDLPYFLDVGDVCYEYILPKEHFNELDDIERKVLVLIERKWNKDQNIAIRDSTFSVGETYGFQSTKIHIMIELYNNEFGRLKEKNIYEIWEEVVQKILEVVIIKYNINMRGKHFINPSISDCSMICIQAYKNWINVKENIIGIITPNTRKKREIESKYEFTDIFNLNTFEYFCYKARYSYDNFDFIDTIVSAAISLESSVYYILRKNISSEEDVDAYTFNKEENKYYSIYPLIRNMIDSKYIEKNEDVSLKRIKESVSKILGCRNDLMHGKLIRLDNLGEKAKKSLQSLEWLIDSLNLVEENFTEEKEGKVILSYNDANMKKEIDSISEMKISERKDFIENLIKKYPLNPYLFILLGNEYFNMGDFRSALDKFKKSLGLTKRKNESLYYVGLTHIKLENYDEAIKAFCEVEELPQNLENHDFTESKYFLNFGEACILAYRKNEKFFLANNDYRYLDYAMKCFERVKDPKYERRVGQSLIIIKHHLGEFLESLSLIDSLESKGKNDLELSVLKCLSLVCLAEWKKADEILQQIYLDSQATDENQKIMNKYVELMCTLANKIIENK